MMTPFERFRKKHKLTQLELGNAIDVGQSAISQYENGRKPEIDVAWRFKKYAESFGDEIPLELIYPEPNDEAA